MARTDDDSWDLATSVGATATLVAAGRALASREHPPLIEDRFAEPLVRAVDGRADIADADGANAALRESLSVAATREAR